MSYILTQAEYTSLRRKLRLAVTSRNAERIARVAQNGLDTFDAKGYPDNWHEWNIALEDAKLDIRRNEDRCGTGFGRF